MTKKKRLQRSPAQIRADLKAAWPEISLALPRLTIRKVFEVANQIAKFEPGRARREAAAKRKEARLLIYEAHALLLHAQYLDLDPNSDVSDLIVELTRVRDSIDDASLLKGSGNKVFNAARKLYTASGCWYLMTRYTDVKPTTYHTGKWVWFSERLFKIATGEDTDMHKACCEWKRQQDDMSRAGITAAEITAARIVIRER